MDLKEATASIAAKKELVAKIRDEVSRVIVGQEKLIDRLLLAFVTDGHILLEGVPGLAKTLSCNTLAKALGLDFKRISFTPDLLPADVIGTMVYSPKTGEFTPKKGPVFTNLLLADEINRAPAKVQSALLEAMQERQVTIGDETYALNKPFLVLATQNPIEQEGTYPLPEAQVDRFMFKCLVEPPTLADERRIMQRFAESTEKPEAKKVVTAEELASLRETLSMVYCDEKVGDYILSIVFKTREKNALIQNGASPRATLALNLASRGNALLKGRAYATPQDVKEVVHDVLRHRILLTYEAEAEGITSDTIIDRILDEVPVP
ncbi:MAG: MoxR family ATPase [Kiritimatiellae bacterium]|jgi:MoxR-like ATPase|nr:MoxR family ATPase [Kiritimatiellia bacterium]